MFQLEFKNVAIIKFEIGTIMNINIMTNTVYDYQTFLAIIDNLMTLMYNDEYIG